MSYLYPVVEGLIDLPTVGTKQCVALIREYTNAPQAITWSEGEKVRGNLLLKKGTAIATFVNGKYQNLVTRNHAAFYISQDAAGIWVVDQWSTSGKIRKRLLGFKGKNKDGTYVDPSNNGDAFSVIE